MTPTITIRTALELPEDDVQGIQGYLDSWVQVPTRAGKKLSGQRGYSRIYIYIYESNTDDILPSPTSPQCHPNV
jgi:hypothetical protein